MLQGANTELGAEIHLQADAAIDARPVDAVPAPEVLHQAQRLHGLLLGVHQRQRGLPEVRPASRARPSNLRVLQQLSREHHVQRAQRGGCDGLRRIAHRQTCCSAQGDAVAPPLLHRGQQRGCEELADGPRPVQEEFGLLEGCLAQRDLPQRRHVPQGSLLHVAGGRQPPKLGGAELGADDADAASVVLPDLLQALLCPEHQVAQGLVLQEGDLGAHQVALLPRGL
mmetsp:Transcript_78569/g.188494  ORF Transcript_78569/g.188494 Transcript_78569/m.188494 type:complete len:226 (-) Transcript_78569:5079-5756(-)